jgi:hypothetical protein
MRYKDKLSEIMVSASEDVNTIFIGQQIVYRGNPMSTTLDGVPKEKMIEVPVMEETQMGMSLGLSMDGYRVITFYPRWDFLISATNQLINHVDKFQLMTGDVPHVIIRVGKGSDKPLDPGHQHKANYFEEFKSMSKNIEYFDCKTVRELELAYNTALNNKGVYVICEYPELYNNFDTFNFICDESSENTNVKNIECLVDTFWYDIKDYKFCSIDEVSKNKEQNYFHVVLFNAYLSFKLNEIKQIPISNQFKNLLRENENFFVVFLTEHECDRKEVIELFDMICKHENLPTEQFYIINGNQKLPNIKNSANSNVNIHVTNRLQTVTTRNMRNEGGDFNFKPLKKYLFSCYNRILKNHRFTMLCSLKKHGILEYTDWSLLKGYMMKEMYGDKINNHFFNNIITDSEIQEMSSEINFFSSIDVKKSEYEENLDIDSRDVNNFFDWNLSFQNNSFQHSYINIVNESQFDIDDCVHITEKSLTPFYYYQIPLIVATKDHKKIMEERYGFDFFNDLVNHSYDDEENHQIRFKMIIEEIKRLTNNKDEVMSFYRDNKNRFHYNKEIVLQIMNDDTDKKFFSKIINNRCI